MKNKVQFGRNITLKDALDSTDKNVVYFTDEASIVMGGKIYGETLEENKKKYLDKLYDEYTDSLFTISSAVSRSTVNPGTEIEVTIYLRNDGVYVTPTIDLICTGFLSNSVFTEISTGIYKTSVHTSSVGVNQSIITAVYQDIVKTHVVSVSCYRDILVGWSPESSIESTDDLRDITNYGPQSSTTGEYQFKNTEAGYYYFLVPSEVKLSSSLDSDNPQGTEGPIPVYFIRRKISDYIVFRIADQQAPSTHLIKFS